MKIALIITCYNRPAYLEQCLESLRNAEINTKDTVIMVDDASTDKRAIELFEGFYLDGVQVLKKRNDQNSGIAYSLLWAYDRAFNQIGADLCINLDNDAIVKPDFIHRLVDLKLKHMENMVTGFNSVTRNSNGTERHKVISKHEGYWLKESVGGINLCIDKQDYLNYVEPALNLALQRKCNWDHKACILSFETYGNAIVCAVPSVVQHIGFDSSMGHKEQPDVAFDFEKKLELPNVTLIGVDGNHLDWLIKAADISCSGINFGAVKLLSGMESTDPRVVPIRPLTSKEAYNEFIIRDLWRYVDTDYLLIIQGDGYVLNPDAWSEDFLKYDYIGATWWYKDGKNVGNGGFSLRTRAFMKQIAKDPGIKNTYPEDHQLCRVYRDHLEKQGFKYAPAEVADRFSIESAYTPDRKYSGQFGFHGWVIDFSEAKGLKHIPKKPAQQSTKRIIQKGTGRGYLKGQVLV